MKEALKKLPAGQFGIVAQKVGSLSLGPKGLRVRERGTETAAEDD